MIDTFNLDASFSDEDLEAPQQTDYKCLRGDFTAVLESVDLGGPDEDNVVLETWWTEFEGTDGSAEVQPYGKIAGRRARWTCWLKFKGEQSDGAVRGMTALGRALGLAAQDSDGKWHLPVVSVEDYVEQAQSLAGVRAVLTMRPKRRQREGKPVSKDDGSPMYDENVTGVKPL